MYSTILMGMSPSGKCDQAVGSAVSLAEASGAELIFFTSCHEPGVEKNDQDTAARLEELQKKMHASCSRQAAHLQSWSVRVAEGFFDIELLKVARKKGVDLIVMGPEVQYEVPDCMGRYREVRNPLERVSREARCPVMIISREVDREKLSFARVVAATDFSRQANCAVDYAIQLAGRQHAHLTLLHVLPDKGQKEAPEDYDQLQERLAKARQRMTALYGERLEAVPLYAMVVREGDPGTEILKYLREEKSDLAVMAHHSTGEDPQEATLGSTTLRVALNACCPTVSCNRDVVLSCGN